MLENVFLPAVGTEMTEQSSERLKRSAARVLSQVRKQRTRQRPVELKVAVFEN